MTLITNDVRIEESYWLRIFLVSGVLGLDQWFSHFSVYPTHLGFVKTQIAGPHLSF